MRRSVIQLAGKTLLVSLPKAWADAQHIRKGQELEVQQAGARLIVGAAAAKRRKEIALTSKDATWFSAEILSLVYQLGADEVVITYEKSATVRDLAVKASQLLGFEIVDERPGKVTIKNVARQMEEEYPVLLRRTFYIVEEMGQLLMRQAHAPAPELQQQMRALDLTVNKLTDFCKRTINKEETHTALATATTYTIVRDLEKVADCYRDACTALARRPPARLALAIGRLNKLFALLPKLVYGFSEENAQAFHDQAKETRDDLRKLMDQAKGTDAHVVHQLLCAATLIGDLFGPLYIGELSTRKDQVSLANL